MSNPKINDLSENLEDPKKLPELKRKSFSKSNRQSLQEVDGMLK